VPFGVFPGEDAGKAGESTSAAGRQVTEATLNARRHSLVLAAVLLWAGTAYADLATGVSPSSQVLAPVAIPSADISPQLPAADAAESSGTPRTGLLAEPPWAALPIAEDDDEPAVRELPGLPSSTSLFLSAMLSVGAWHMVRRAGHLHVASLPEWYHPDAPHQIGHSVAFDPLAGFVFLPVCLFETPLDLEPPRIPETPREIPSRLWSQHFLTVESPRGPPALA